MTNRKMSAEQKKYKKVAGVDYDINRRWEKGTEHHPRAVELADKLGELDYLFQNDSLCLKFGGDGDNGEALLYILDIAFEEQDKKEQKAKAKRAKAKRP